MPHAAQHAPRRRPRAGPSSGRVASCTIQVPRGQLGQRAHGQRCPGPLGAGAHGGGRARLLTAMSGGLAHARAAPAHAPSWPAAPALFTPLALPALRFLPSVIYPVLRYLIYPVLGPSCEHLRCCVRRAWRRQSVGWPGRGASLPSGAQAAAGPAAPACPCSCAASAAAAPAAAAAAPIPCRRRAAATAAMPSAAPPPAAAAAALAQLCAVVRCTFTSLLPTLRQKGPCHPPHACPPTHPPTCCRSSVPTECCFHTAVTCEMHGLLASQLYTLHLIECRRRRKVTGRRRASRGEVRGRRGRRLQWPAPRTAHVDAGQFLKPQRPRKPWGP